MNAAREIHEDGNLPAALHRLGNAISALIDPKPHTRQLDDGDTRIEWIDALYDQLCDAVPGGQGNATRIPQSSPPMCIDAVDLLNEIRHTLAKLAPRPEIDALNPAPIDVVRLRELDDRQWRPQDCDTIDTLTARINGWCESIKTMINPEPKWSLPNPCPACSTAIVYRHNSAGEIVRQRALQIGPLGCVCQNCHQVWQPEYFRHLASVLGYELPPSVLE